jgi:hypothetical protein
MMFFDTGPMLFTFVSLGRFLEHKAKGHTSDALSKLMALQSTDAILLVPSRDGDDQAAPPTERIIDVQLLQLNDLVKVGCMFVCIWFFFVPSSLQWLFKRLSPARKSRWMARSSRAQVPPMRFAVSVPLFFGM